MKYYIFPTELEAQQEHRRLLDKGLKLSDVKYTEQVDERSGSVIELYTFYEHKEEEG